MYLIIRATCSGRKKFDSDIRCVASVQGRHGKLAVGLSDGIICLIDKSGKILETGKLDSSIEKILSVENHIYAGTRDGAIAKFNLE